MATNFMETAKSVRTGARDLLERIEQNRKAAAALLDSAKAAESRLVEKEARQRKIREEKEKAERLQRFLESGETGGYVADAEPEPAEKLLFRPEHAAEQRRLRLYLLPSGRL